MARGQKPVVATISLVVVRPEQASVPVPVPVPIECDIGHNSNGVFSGNMGGIKDALGKLIVHSPLMVLSVSIENSACITYLARQAAQINTRPLIIACTFVVVGVILWPSPSFRCVRHEKKHSASESRLRICI